MRLTSQPINQLPKAIGSMWDERYIYIPTIFSVDFYGFSMQTKKTWDPYGFNGWSSAPPTPRTSAALPPEQPMWAEQETNSLGTNGPQGRYKNLGEESSLPTTIFQGLCKTSGGYPTIQMTGILRNGYTLENITAGSPTNHPFILKGKMIFQPNLNMELCSMLIFRGVFIKPLRNWVI